ncbi:hypothetical protein HK100_001414 [Physocladia obscura]|uniref:FAS1 domain-containing protein n=1 Tax=Physocladia obscura TaxID=109957 RepID=A0AAD5SX23_9FUNG|nr:hypothetical protein HK100_001414 [Physocladia obscura]
MRSLPIWDRALDQFSVDAKVLHMQVTPIFEGKSVGDVVILQKADISTGQDTVLLHQSDTMAKIRLTWNIIAAKSIPSVATDATGQTLAVSFDGTNVLVSGGGNTKPAHVLVADVLADSVLVHMIDEVLLPGSATTVAATTTSANKVYSGADGVVLGGVAALVAAVLFCKGLLSLIEIDVALFAPLSTFNGTLFVPTNSTINATVKAGFNMSDINTLTNLMLYHSSATPFSGSDFNGTAFVTTQQGNEIKITGSTANGIQILSAYGTPPATILKTHTFDGGYIHIINRALIPPTNLLETTKLANLTSFISAISAANLTDAFSVLEGVTVFAPMNAAFEAIANVTWNLMGDQLREILWLHVVPGVFHETDFEMLKSVPALDTNSTVVMGQTLNVRFDGVHVLVSGEGNKVPAIVVVPDVLVDWMVVHVVDEVLLPSGL